MGYWVITQGFKSLYMQLGSLLRLFRGTSHDVVFTIILVFFNIQNLHYDWSYLGFVKNLATVPRKYLY